MDKVTFEYNDKDGTVEGIYTDQDGERHVFIDAEYENGKVYYQMYFPLTLYGAKIAKCFDTVGETRSILMVLESEVMLRVNA